MVIRHIRIHPGRCSENSFEVFPMVVVSEPNVNGGHAAHRGQQRLQLLIVRRQPLARRRITVENHSPRRSGGKVQRNAFKIFPGIESARILAARTITSHVRVRKQRQVDLLFR